MALRLGREWLARLWKAVIKKRNIILHGTGERGIREKYYKSKISMYTKANHFTLQGNRNDRMLHEPKRSPYRCTCVQDSSFVWNYSCYKFFRHLCMRRMQCDDFIATLQAFDFPILFEYPTIRVHMCHGFSKGAHRYSVNLIGKFDSHWDITIRLLSHFLVYTKLTSCTKSMKILVIHTAHTNYFIRKKRPFQNVSLVQVYALVYFSVNSEWTFHFFKL